MTWFGRSAAAGPKPKVVVVGGGAAGAALARNKLAAAADVTLVDPKEFYECNIWAPRAAVDPTWGEEQIIWEYNLPKGVARRTGAVAAIDGPGNAVRLVDGSAVVFDHLVVCTGSTYRSGNKVTKPSPGCNTKAARASEFQAIWEELKAAPHVLIVGGGPTGVEFAAEVVEALPGKKVTLVHSKPELLHMLKAKARTVARDFLIARGVRLILDDKVDAVDGSAGPWTTAKGVQIPAGKAYVMTGVMPNTQFMPPNALNANGEIEVSAMLTVEAALGTTHPVHALGDCAVMTGTASDLKLAYAAGEQAKYVATALLKAISGKTHSKAYKPVNPGPSPPMMVVTLGPKSGVMQTPVGIFVSWLPRKLKAAPKSLLLGKIQTELRKPLYD